MVPSRIFSLPLRKKKGYRRAIHPCGLACVLRVAFRAEPPPISSGQNSNELAACFLSSQHRSISIAEDLDAGRMDRLARMMTEAPSTRNGVHIPGIRIRRWALFTFIFRKITCGPNRYSTVSSANRESNTGLLRCFLVKGQAECARISKLVCCAKSPQPT